MIYRNNPSLPPTAPSARAALAYLLIEAVIRRLDQSGDLARLLARHCLGVELTSELAARVRRDVDPLVSAVPEAAPVGSGRAGRSDHGGRVLAVLAPWARSFKAVTTVTDGVVATADALPFDRAARALWDAAYPLTADALRALDQVLGGFDVPDLPDRLARAVAEEWVIGPTPAGAVSPESAEEEACGLLS
jgi:hypothetical protein